MITRSGPALCLGDFAWQAQFVVICRTRYTRTVVLIFEILLVLSSLLITWFAVYVVYRLVTDERKQHK